MKRVIKNKSLAFLLAFVIAMMTMFPTMVYAEDDANGLADIVTVTITEADMAELSEDFTAIESAINRQGVSNVTSITELKVITEGSAYLSPEDNMYLKNNFTSLVYLDESKCACSTKNLTEKYLIKSGLPDKKYAEFGGLSGFSSLSTLILPDETQIINSYQVCETGLTTLILPNNVLIIENGAFSSNTALTSDLIIPDSVILIGNNAFGAGTIKINSGKLILGDSVKYIDNSAFTKRIFSGNLIIPDSVETIGSWAFESGAFQDGTWKLGTGLRSVGDAAMSNICSGNRGMLFISSQLATQDTCFGYNTFSEVVFEEGTTTIGTRVVRNSEKITSVVLPTTVKTIGGQAFLNCSALESVVFPNGLQSIGTSAFDGTKISGIYIPNTVTTINATAFERLPQNSVLYAPNNEIFQLLSEDNSNQWLRRYDRTRTALAITNGGIFSADTTFAVGILNEPIKEGYVFDGWYDNESFNGESVTDVESGKTYYAKWIEIEPVELQYSQTKPITVLGMTDMTGWSSSDESVVTVDESGNATAVNVGTAKIFAEGIYKGRKQNFTITVNVSPMLITYGRTSDDVIDGNETYNRPAIVYSQSVGKEEQLSDHIWFYPAKESVDADSGEKIYIPDTDASPIELAQGDDLKFSYIQNDNHAESVSVLPFLETLDSEGNSEAIDVIVDLQNKNYKFVTIGTLWKPWDQILLRVTVMAEGMERISMMNGDELLQNSLEKRILEYTGEGVAPAYDLTGISAEDIGEFTVHFHSVIEGISYDTHLYNKQPAELSADAVQAIAPKELGIYSMVVNGQNDEAKKYAYVSRRFEITKGNPTGEPEFDAVDSNVELSAIELSGSMKNAAGKPVEGVFEWIDDSQTVEQGAGYAWRFTPDDTEHYNAAEGESVVYPEEKPGSDKEDLAALIEYAQDAKDAENYKYVVPKVKELFEKALEDAIAVNAKEDATQKEIDAAYDALLAKVHLLDFTGNTESLTVLVGTASGKVEAMYTKESWAPFAEALEAAREVLADENALQAEIDTARDVLQAAMDALVENPIDTSKLEKLVADASVYEENLENYIPSTAESFMAALDGAREVLAGSEITQDAVDSAYATLLNAIFGLREVPNKDRLEELLGKVEAMDLSSYSEETANAVKAAVAMAAAVMEDENANQKQVDAAVAALEEAVAGLEAKEEVGTDDINTDNTESGDIDNGSKKDDSSVTDQKVASNDEGSKDTANKTTTAKTNAKTAAQTGDAAKAAVPAVAAAAALLAVWFVWKKK